MADESRTHAGAQGHSPEEIAFWLLEVIAKSENKPIRGQMDGKTTLADKNWLLSNYADCIRTVRSGQFVPK
jgi:hypothetical protein